MPAPTRTQPVRILDGVAFALLAVQVAFRLTAWTEYAGWGTKLVVHLMVFLAAGCWFVARSMDGRMSWRFSGFEIPMGGIALLSLVSVFRTTAYPMGALDGAVAYGSFALLFPMAYNVFGGTRRSLLNSLLHGATLTLALYGLLQWLWFLPQTAASKELAKYIATSGDIAVELSNRARSLEPWSTFFYPNTFAGFLVLMIPFALGSLIDLPVKFKAALFIRLVTITAACVALYATGSFGAFVSLVAGAGVFALLAGVRRFPTHARRIWIGAGIALVAGIVASAAMYPKIVRRVEAFTIRDVYWQATIAMAKDHALLGVGMNNFQEYYTQYKDDRQEESIKTHNNYLQVLAELGIPGLLCLLGLFFVAARRGLRPDPEPPAPDPESPGGMILAIGIFIGLAGAFLFQHSLSEIGGGPWLALILGIAWSAAVLLTRSADASTDDRDPAFTRIGLIAGVAGVAVHFLVDFDFYDYTFMEAFVLVLVALALAGRRGPVRETGGVMPGIAGVLCFAIALPMFALMVPGFLEGDDLRREGDRASRSRNPVEALSLFEESARENGLDPQVHFQIGMVQYEMWKHVLGRPGRHVLGEVALGEKAEAAFAKALELRPRWGSALFWLTMIHEGMARHAANGVAKGEFDGPKTAGFIRRHLDAAETSARKALEYYPTRAENHYLLGRVLDSLGRSGEAVKSYREALRLGDLAGRVPRLRMGGFQRAACILFSGGTEEEATKQLRDYVDEIFVESQVGITKDQARKRLKDIIARPEAFMEHYDERMSKILDRAVDELLARYPE